MEPLIREASASSSSSSRGGGGGGRATRPAGRGLVQEVGGGPAEGEEVEVETVVEEVRGLPSLRIKPRVVISDKKKEKDQHATSLPGIAAATTAQPSAIINRGRLCSVCAAHFGCYTCPRCNAASCSLACYKAHSVKCTEAFYKENVEEELRSQRADEADREKMLQLLKRMKDQEDEEEEDEHEAELYYRLAQLSTEDNLSLDLLTPEQREDFLKSLVDGRISDAIPLWQPWWIHTAAGLISPVVKDDAEESEDEDEDEVGFAAQNKPPPTILPNIPPLSTLLNKEPSPLLVFHLVDILFSYAYVMRYFNGEPESEASEAVSYLTEISAVLQTNTVHASLESALDACLASLRKPAVSGSSEVGLAVVDDVKRIVAQKSFVMMALSDLHSLVARSIEELNGPGSAKQVQPKERKRLLSKLTAMQKKIYFFLVWANEQLDPLFSSTAALVELYGKEKRAARGASTTDASANPISSSSIRIPDSK